MAIPALLTSVSRRRLSCPLVSERSGLPPLVCWAALALRKQRVRAPQPALILWLAVVVALLGATLCHRVAPVLFAGDAWTYPGQCGNAGDTAAVRLDRFWPLMGKI